MRALRKAAVVLAAALVSTAALAGVAGSSQADELLPYRDRCVLTIDDTGYTCFYGGVGYTVDQASRTVVANGQLFAHCSGLVEPFSLAACRLLAGVFIDVAVGDTGASVHDASWTIVTQPVWVPRVCVLGLEPCVGGTWVDLPLPDADVSLTLWVGGMAYPINV